MASSVQYGRKKPLPTCPNPLFLQWLTEWRDAATEKGQKTQFVYQKAISSLRKYPLPLRNGKEAKILQNFGDGICRMLDEKLSQYYAENGPEAPIHALPSSGTTEQSEEKRERGTKAKKPPPDKPVASSATETLSEEEEERMNGGPSPTKKKKEQGSKKPREYVPQKRSGGYAVLLTLYRDTKNPNGRGFMTKSELQREAQALCEKSFTLTHAGSKYTAWSSVSTLIQKGLVIKTNSPARYSLTEKGLELAEKMEQGEGSLRVEAATALSALVHQRVDLTQAASTGGAEVEEPLPAVALTSRVDLNDTGRGAKQSGGVGYEERTMGSSSSEHSQDSLESGTDCRRPPLKHAPEFTLRPGQFRIILCVDFIETTGGVSLRKQELVTELKKNGVPFDVRKLHVGDFLWIAQEKVTPVPGQLRAPTPRELVLDYVVERKRMDDLCGSIIDGRFREQKFRLKRCGLRNPIYLVEDHGSAQHLSIPETTLHQAIVNTQVVDGFFIKRTKDVRESAAYLTIMTRYLRSLFSPKTLLSCTKEEESECREAFSPSAPSCVLMTFGEFSEGAVKHKAQTVKELFARQLMQISGISGEKAAAIVGKYSTPASLLGTYEELPTMAEKEKLLANIKCGNLQRNLGPVLSKLIAQLYCTPGPLC
ncbi:crossover junction endonuclease MUS81 [Latimeria chalumnae]|uniref:crossover junction endonuclease MUS81 n=1 Tax=Latimeria chalumnae TaxID=7897 RepID=UPI00313C306B